MLDSLVRLVVALLLITVFVLLVANRKSGRQVAQSAEGLAAKRRKQQRFA